MLRVNPTFLLATWRGSGRNSPRVQVYETPCIVTSPPNHLTVCDALVNAANERLEGTQFTPSECNRRLLGETIIYPPQAVDGLVTEFGGPPLSEACANVPESPIGSGLRCPTGGAVLTESFGELVSSYSHIIHAVAPFYGDDRDVWCCQLLKCYNSAFRTAANARLQVIAVPLLGAGARGAPTKEAAELAALSTAQWFRDLGAGELALQEIRFAVQQPEVANTLVEALGNEFSSVDGITKLH